MAKYLGGIIFDMDNTLLSSKINFKQMKQRVFAGLTAAGFLPDEAEQCSTSQLLAWAEQICPENRAFLTDLWQAVAEEEVLGLSLAAREPGACDVLQALKDDYFLVLLTNNQQLAAREALQKAGILPHLHQVWGRESVPALKPSPLGFEKIMAENPDLSKWLAIGDAWNDGAAALAAGVPFIAYVGNRREKWPQKEVEPMQLFHRWSNAEIAAIKQFFRPQSE